MSSGLLLSSGTLCPLGSVCELGLSLGSDHSLPLAKGCHVKSLLFPIGQIYHAHSLYSCTRKDSTKPIPRYVLTDSQSSHIHVGVTESILGYEVRASQEVPAIYLSPCLAFPMGAGDLISGPSACTASALPIQPSPQRCLML